MCSHSLLALDQPLASLSILTLLHRSFEQRLEHENNRHARHTRQLNSITKPTLVQNLLTRPLGKRRRDTRRTHKRHDETTHRVHQQLELRRKREGNVR